MSRRYLTAEDVRAAKGGEVVIDERTLVTPQAQELAAELGLAIRTAGGDWTEPVPDRGPDSPYGSRGEIEASIDGASSEGAVVTVVGLNRPGVLAEITRALADCGAGVRDISQRMVGEHFHLILTVEPEPGAAFDKLKQELECLGGKNDYMVRVMHERVFRYMHRV